MLLKTRMPLFSLLVSVMLVIFSGCDGGENEEATKSENPTSSVMPLTVTSPVRLDSTSDGELLASDAFTQAVHIVDKASLQVLSSVRIDGEPAGIGVLEGGFLVGNLTTQSVEHYSLDGTRISTFASGITRPTSIAVDSDAGKVFVLDSFAKVVRVFDTSGAVQADIPAVGQAPLDTPTAITVDTLNQRVWVSDYGPFDPENGGLSFGKNGAFVHSYDYSGAYQETLSGSFSRPQGLAVAGHKLYVTDCVLGQILVFDIATSALLQTIGSPGTAPGELLFPLDVLVDLSSAKIFTANNQLGRIEVFQGGQP